MKKPLQIGDHVRINSRSDYPGDRRAYRGYKGEIVAINGSIAYVLWNDWEPIMGCPGYNTCYLERLPAPKAANAPAAPKVSAITPRPLHEIAREIKRLFVDLPYKTTYAAQPYLNAMATLTSPSASYGYDDGRSIVLYFLSNVASWRGDDARRLKAELKVALKQGQSK
jgi:hypothetical protein